jgi:hypothetical protein
MIGKINAVVVFVQDCKFGNSLTLAGIGINQ